MIVTASSKAYDATLHRALFEKLNSQVGPECLAAQVRNGSVTLYEICADGSLLGIILTSIDVLIDGSRELVIRNAAAVNNPPVAMTSVLDLMFDQIALDHGLDSVRVHSDKKGLDRLLERASYQYQESIYRKNINVGK